MVRLRSESFRWSGVPVKGEKVGFGWAASLPTQTPYSTSAHVGRIGHKANYVWINFSKFISALLEISLTVYGQAS